MAICDTRKEQHYLYSHVKINRASSFFTPFISISDFKAQARTPIIIPIVGLSLTLHAAINTCRNLLETAINLVFLDIDSMKTSVPAFFDSAVQAIYYAATCLMDTLWNFLALTCRTLTTAAYGTPIIIEAIAEGIFSSQTVLNSC